MAHADEIMASIADKQAQAADLRVKLEGSLLIEKLVPGAFKHGTVKVGARASLRTPHEGVVTFRLGDGTVVEKPAMEVPYRLWPDGLKRDFMDMRDQRLRRSVERRLR